MRTPRPKRLCAPAHRRPSRRCALPSFPSGTARHTLRRSIPPQRSFQHPAPTLHSSGPFRPSFLPPRQSPPASRFQAGVAAGIAQLPDTPFRRSPTRKIPGILFPGSSVRFTKSPHDIRRSPRREPPRTRTTGRESPHAPPIRTRPSPNAPFPAVPLPSEQPPSARNRRSAPETPPGRATRCGTDRSRPARPCRASPPARRSPARRTPAYRPQPPCRPRP